MKGSTNAIPKDIQNIVNRVSNLELITKPTITSISSVSTDDEVPTAKAVYDYIDEMINGALEESY